MNSTMYEPLHTLSEARDILYYDRKRQQNKIYFIKQKLYGVLMILISVAFFFCIEEPGEFLMALLLFASIGIYATFTKQKILVIEGWNDGRF